MNLENTAIFIAAGAGFIGTIGFFVAWAAYRKCSRHRGLIEFVGKQNSDLEESLNTTTKLLENTQQRSSDQARRIAWLEMRVRQPQSVKEDVILNENNSSKSFKSNITERRHRVLSLSSRGQSTEKIAATLGMMPGEVELIVKLNGTMSVAN